jgi:hypothetical protein
MLHTFIRAVLVCFLCWGTGKAAAAEDKAMTGEKIRESAIAGSWYPGESENLKKMLQDFLEKVPEPVCPGQLTALISPHAGYVYSGQTAAYAYKFLEKQSYDTVVVIAPSHRARFAGVSVYDQGGFKTPFGVMPLDTEIISALKAKDAAIRFIPEAHASEHSLEIQLPFIQYLMPKARLVPLVMGDQSLQLCQSLAKTIADTVKGKSVLLVASTDLSHFHPDKEARKLDQVVQDKVKNFDPEGLGNALASGECEACGGGPVAAVMLAAKMLGANQTQILKYSNSGEISGDYERVVGYLSAAIWKNAAQKKGAADFGLSDEDKKVLHQIVRDTIEGKCLKKPPKAYDISPTLKELRGAFVTLHKHGQLRGCIGHIVAHFPLAETISRMATAAAFEDPRFPPVTAEELKDLEIEISVLTPFQKISNVEEIQVGVHGIYMKKGFHSGLLLPQVATEYKWDRKTFLEQTCRKAGLPGDAWKAQDMEIYVFSADIF